MTCTWRLPGMTAAGSRVCRRTAPAGGDRCREHEYRMDRLPGWRLVWRRERDEARAALALAPADPYWAMRLAGAEHIMEGRTA